MGKAKLDEAAGGNLDKIGKKAFLCSVSKLKRGFFGTERRLGRIWKQCGSSAIKLSLKEGGLGRGENAKPAVGVSEAAKHEKPGG